MPDKTYNELALEKEIQSNFGVDITISNVISDRLPVGHTSEAALFLTNKKQLYVYIHGKSKLLLSDIKKIVSKMGLTADVYIPPKGQPRYFEDVALNKFRAVFPGRKHVNDSDLIFYRTLVPYNPALVLISEIKNGEVYQFDSDSTTSWRPSVKFAYRRIRTS